MAGRGGSKSGKAGSVPQTSTGQQWAADAYSDLRSGKSIDVVNPNNGKRFTIVPKGSGLQGYAVFVDGKRQTPYKILGGGGLRDWLSDLRPAG